MPVSVDRRFPSSRPGEPTADPHPGRPAEVVKRRRHRGVAIGMAAAAVLALAACGSPDTSGIALDADDQTVTSGASASPAPGGDQDQLTLDPTTAQGPDDGTGTVDTSSLATHQQWNNPPARTLHNPTLSLPFTFSCKDYASPGGAVLYPYTVPEGSSRVFRADQSTPGVRVVNDPLGGEVGNLVLTVTSYADKGTHDLVVSFPCQADSPGAWYTTGDPSVTAVTGQSATISTPFLTGNRTASIMYRVNYGPSEGAYSNSSDWATGNLPANATTPMTSTVTGLQPGVYHYRVESCRTGFDSNSCGSMSYSGPDLTFTTSPS